MRNKAERSNFP